MEKRKPLQPVLLVAGPTAVGKSRCGLRLADSLGGIVINGDSMQIYKDLKVLTAQPTPEEQRHIPHELYGVLESSDPCTAARWQSMALEVIKESHNQGKIPIVVGGTGLYLQALRDGLSDIPPVDPQSRMQARQLYKEIGGEAFHTKLQKVDPESAHRLHPQDQQRLIRAWEVFQSTGKPLGFWTKTKHTRPIEHLRFFTLVLDAKREVLEKAAHRRLQKMLEAGVLEEVRAFSEQSLPPEASLKKAVGLRELQKHLKGEMSLEEALAEITLHTRQYIKRQQTWFRNQFQDSERLYPFDEKFEESFLMLEKKLRNTALIL